MKRVLIEREIPGANDLTPAQRTGKPTRNRKLVRTAAPLALAVGALVAVAGPLGSPASAEADTYCHDLRASREIDLTLGAWYGWAANATGGDWGLNLMADQHYFEAMETGDMIAKYCP